MFICAKIIPSALHETCKEWQIAVVAINNSLRKLPMYSCSYMK